MKKACDSGKCSCKGEKGKESHFHQACAAMGTECSSVKLDCAPTTATCDGKGVSWPAPVSAVEADKKEKKDTKDKKDEKKEKGGKQAKKDEKYVAVGKHDAKVKEVQSRGHHDFARGIIVTMVLLSITIAMAASANAIVSKNTWSVIDFVIVTFLALSWFIVVGHSFDYFKVIGLTKVLVHMLVSIAFLLTSIFVSFHLKKTKGLESTSIFNGIFTPLVMWINAGFVQTVQQQDSTALAVFGHLMVLVIYYAVLAVAMFYLSSKATEKGWGDDTIGHMTGGALAGGFVLWLHMVITGSFQAATGTHKNPPTIDQTVIMLCLSAVFLAADIVVSPILKKIVSNLPASKYWIGRILDVVVQFIGFLPRFSFVFSLAHLIVENLGYSDGAVAAQLHMALACTAVGIVMILVAAYVPAVKNNEDLTSVLVGLGGFIVGVAWSGMLDNSVDMMVKGGGYSHPFEIKLGITAMLTAFVFPVYCFTLKPIITSKGC